jgi:diguanylate cyclase (GGDEF)-like protein/PAS domain S-box-containing protein
VRTVLLVTIYVLAGLGLKRVAATFETAAQISPWDPSSSLHFVLLLGFGLRYTPELLFIPLLDMLVVRPLSIPPFYILVCALWIMLGYSVASALLLHKLHIDPCLRRFRDVFRFSIMSLVAPLVVSALFVATFAKAGSISWSDWGIQVVRDWAGQATGIAMLAPPLLLLLRAAPWAGPCIAPLKRPASPINLGWPKRRQALECIAEFIALAAAIWLAYGLPAASSLEYSYFVFLPLIWIAVRHGFERAVLAVLSINIGVVLLVHVQSSVNNTLALQFCLLTASYTGLLVGAVVTEGKWVEASLRESEKRYQNLYDCAPDAYFSVAADGTIRSANQTSTSFLGYRKEELIGKPVWITIHEADRGWAQQRFTRVFREKLAITENELRKVRKDGSVIWVRERSQLLFDEDGAPIELHMISRDITERKQAEEQLLHNAFHDALTGLPNRTLFMDRLERAVEHGKRHEDYLFAVLFLDLDRFKVINDSLGHTLGDQLLIAIAGRLKVCLRPTDTAARLGGDEFTILLEDIKDISDAIRVAERIQEQLRSPFHLSRQEVFTSASIGIVFRGTDYNQPEDLLRDADIAMYRAKVLGKARYEIFNIDMRDRAVARLQLETELRRAIERQEFRIHYQPIVSLGTGRVIGFEALVRWQHPDRGLVCPAEFMPIAEETGLSVPIDQWVLLEACRQTHQWQKRFPPNAADGEPFKAGFPGEYLALTISVNLGSSQFRQPGLLQQIDEVLQETNLNASSLKLEITENIIMENHESATVILSQLRGLGIQLVIDDFGTGYSSLGRLHRFPIDILKIDRSFVSKIGTNGKNFEIAETIITLAQKLGVEVTAEGVETVAQLAQLRGLNCAYGQGYFFSQPLDTEAIEGLMMAQPQW